VLSARAVSVYRLQRLLTRSQVWILAAAAALAVTAPVRTVAQTGWLGRARDGEGGRARTIVV